MPTVFAYLQLANGQIVEVPPALIKRQKQHFTTLAGTGTSFTCTQIAACEASTHITMLCCKAKRNAAPSSAWS